MKKVDLKICVGTMCYVMGGAELKDYVENLPEEALQHLNVSFSPCLGCYNKKETPPYIEFNGQLISGVSKQSLKQILKEEISDAI